MKRLTALLLVVALATAGITTVGSSTVAAAQSVTLPVTGTVIGGGSFVGTFALQKFAIKDGVLVAVGTLTGTLTNAAGLVTTILRNITLPVLIGQATCDILHLELGPISLDLLGLQVDLSKIVLDITAQSGAGNLLGNLLCAVAGLLDNPSGLVNLLNNILALLG